MTWDEIEKGWAAICAATDGGPICFTLDSGKLVGMIVTKRGHVELSREELVTIRDRLNELFPNGGAK